MGQKTFAQVEISPPKDILRPYLIHLEAMKTAFLLLMISAFAFAAEGTDEKAVRAAVTKFVDAAHAGDEATLNGLLGDGLIYAHSNAKIETKAQCVAALVKSKPHFEMKPHSTVQMYGNSAVVHGELVAHGMTDGKATTTALDYVMVWVKMGNSWKMVARHTAKLPVT